MLLIMCTLIVASIMAIPYYPILGFFGGLIVIAIEKSEPVIPIIRPKQKAAK